MLGASQPHILVIGGASVDRLRADGAAVTTPGGGALYTALAVRRAGGAVRFFGMRPDPLPGLFTEAAASVEWIGPPCRVEDLPHFEIIYDEAGDARLERANWGTEDTLDPAMLPDEFLVADYIHVAAISDPALQMRFVQALRRRSKARISAGTFGYMVHRAPDTVRALQEACDLFFLNAFESEHIFGNQPPTVRPGQILVVTRGADGADVWQGDHCTRVPCCPAQPVDLTGAGDSVCGGMLAGLLQGLHPTAALLLGGAVAAVTIEAPGMTALLACDREQIRSRQTPLRDLRVTIDPTRIDAVADRLRALPDIRPFDFTGPHFPAIGQAGTLDFFFAGMLHQFGFWSPAHGAYAGPTLAVFGGERLKGSDYAFAACKRMLDARPEQMAPHGQAQLRWSDTEALFRADDGSVPMPVLANHHSLSRGYGRDMWEVGWTPQGLVAAAGRSDRPVKFLLQALDHISGYREDPLRKKAMLLVLALGQRPEGFLDLQGGRDLAPIIDYHLMRSCLRTGLVQVHDDELRAKLAGRRLLATRDEAAVRAACFEAIQVLAAQSGRDHGTIDWFFFGARRRCPEVEAPDCAACPMDPACAHRKELFQPVVRTTFY